MTSTSHRAVAMRFSPPPPPYVTYRLYCPGFPISSSAIGLQCHVGIRIFNMVEGRKSASGDEQARGPSLGGTTTEDLVVRDGFLIRSRPVQSSNTLE